MDQCLLLEADVRKDDLINSSYDIRVKSSCSTQNATDSHLIILIHNCSKPSGPGFRVQYVLDRQCSL